MKATINKLKKLKTKTSNKESINYHFVKNLQLIFLWEIYKKIL
ncbi:hypothetical protein IWX87_003915 [Polaromonas sp. CG_9.7]|nr:hypothetical protein [Polaromonas sp. CG_9.7]MBG6116138.1 hypothetical protein [Polaromonas sp. CG_9.2]MDH6185339.1 hypothetical protein [Polaromonas sp. CG_23.6]